VLASGSGYTLTLRDVMAASVNTGASSASITLSFGSAQYSS
jgi:hypothetical protein